MLTTCLCWVSWLAWASQGPLRVTECSQRHAMGGDLSWWVSHVGQGLYMAMSQEPQTAGG